MKSKGMIYQAIEMAKSKRDSPNQGSNLGPYPGKRIHILLMKARCEGYVITATLSGPRYLKLEVKFSK